MYKKLCTLALALVAMPAMAVINNNASAKAHVKEIHTQAEELQKHVEQLQNRLNKLEQKAQQALQHMPESSRGETPIQPMDIDVDGNNQLMEDN